MIDITLGLLAIFWRIMVYMCWTCVVIGFLCFLYINISFKYWKERGISYEKPHLLWGNLYGLGIRCHIKSVLQVMYNKYRDDAILVGFYTWMKPRLLLLNLKSITNILNGDKVKKSQQRFRRKTSLLPDLKEVQEMYTNFLESNLQGIKQLVECNISDLIEETHCKILSYLLYRGDKDDKNETEEASSISNDDIIDDVKENLNRDLFKRLLEKLSVFSGQISCLYPFAVKFFNYYYPYNSRDINSVKKLITEQYEKSPENYRFLHDIITNGNIRTLSGKTEDCLHCTRPNKENDEVELSVKTVTLDNGALKVTNFIATELLTTTSLLSCALLELAVNPNIQNKARLEIKQICEDKGFNSVNDLTVDELLKHFKYLKQIIFETARKYSPLPVAVGVSKNDYDLPESIYMIEQGNSYVVPIDAIHHDERYYDRPNEFNPEHFSSAQVEGRPKYAFMPFGLSIAQHDCVLPQWEDHFTLQLVLIGLIRFLIKYEFKPSMNTIIPIEYNTRSLLMKPRHQIRLMLRAL